MASAKAGGAGTETPPRSVVLSDASVSGSGSSTAASHQKGKRKETKTG